jgi:hypothetical protein
MISGSLAFWRKEKEEEIAMLDNSRNVHYYSATSGP